MDCKADDSEHDATSEWDDLIKQCPEKLSFSGHLTKKEKNDRLAY